MKNVELKQLAKKRLADGDVELPPLKQFKPKYNLPVLNDYRKGTDERYWKFWPKVTWKESRKQKSKINPEKLKQMALDTGFEDTVLLDLVFNDLKHGARFGCIEKFRVPSTSSNAPSAYEEGEKVSEAICEWLDQGYAIGPMDKEEIPFDWIKISGLMTKLKPNGKVRLILNLSRGKPCCVNDGIDKKEFPTVMGSIKKVLIMLHSCGHAAEFCKNDWSAAYKQFSVCSEDVQLQFFTWLGKYFAELSLVFGGVSSAGIYDRVAKVVLHVAMQLSGMPPHLVCQYLDDVVGISPAGSGQTQRFDKTYQQVCQAVGIELASRKDPDKCFGPTTEGIILGVVFNTVDWVWSIRDEKLARILIMLREAMEADQLEQRVIKSLYGKLEHIRELIPNSKFHIGQIVRASAVSEDLNARINIWDWCKHDMDWWYTYLPVFSGRSPIPDPELCLSSSASLHGFTDAAGGSMNHWGNGVGAFLPPDSWSFIAYGLRINGPGVDETGRKLCRKMSAWELAAPLLLMCSMPERLMGGQLIIWVDNSGSVLMFKKGYSTKCNLCCTLITAIHELSVALGCEVELRKIRRCSDSGSKAADHLSKNALKDFHQLVPGAKQVPEAIPEPLIEWIMDPVPDRFLGKRILNVMSKFYRLVGYN